MIRNVTAIFIAVFLFGCASSPITDEPPFLGEWVLTPDLNPGLPTSCYSGVDEYTKDQRLISRSGRGIFIAAFTQSEVAGGYKLAMHLISHNAQPNCQGRPAKYVADHWAPTIIVEIHGDELWQYIIGKDFAAPLIFKRSAVQPGVQADRP